MDQKQINGGQKSPEEEQLAQMELIIGKIMRAGVLAALAAMIIGMLLLLVHPVSDPTDFPTRLGTLLVAVGHLEPMGWMMLGLLLLIFTPVLRVIVSIVAFAKIHDHLYTTITILVLVILALAIAYGYHVG